MALYMRNGLNVSTRRAYESAQKLYVEFCSAHNVEPLPATETTLIYWAAHLAGIRHVTYNTIKHYLAAVRSLHVDNGLPNNIPDMSQLKRALRGIRRLQGDTKRPPRLPITITRLQQWRPLFNHSNFDHRVVWAAMCTGTYCLMRLSELVPPQPAGDANILQYRDLTAVSDNHFQLNLAVSKTDPFRHGVRIDIFRNDSPTCPIAALTAAGIDPREPRTGPLFRLSNGSHLAQPSIRQWVQHCCRRTNTTMHGFSFRRGGASSLAEGGAPDHVTRVAGRWQSYVYQVYIEVPADRIRSCFQVASSTSTSVATGPTHTRFGS